MMLSGVPPQAPQKSTRTMTGKALAKSQLRYDTLFTTPTPGHALTGWLSSLFSRRKSESWFAHALMAEFVRLGVTPDSMRYEKGSGHIDFTDSERHIQLDALISDWYRCRRNRRTQMLQQFATGIHQSFSDMMPSTFVDAQPTLFPRLRSVCHYPLLEMQLQLEGRDFPLPATSPLNNELCVDLIRDSELATASIPGDQWDTWGIPFSEGLSSALFNLRRASTGELRRHPSGFYVGPWEDGNAASRLLLDTLTANTEFKGAPVALIPSHNLLIISGTEDPSLQAAAETAWEVFREDPRRLCGTTFRLTEGQWQAWLPASGPAQRTLKTMQATETAHAYHTQKQCLEKLHPDGGFIASLMVLQHDDNGVITAASWPAGIDTLLPHADILITQHLSEEGEAKDAPIFVRLQDVLAHAPHLLEVTDDQPVRYRTLGFPDQAFLSAHAQEVQA